MKVLVKVITGRPKVRMVPVLGPAVELDRRPDPTPQRFGLAPHKRNLLVATELTATQKRTLSVRFVDRRGNPAPVDGAPQWLTDNTDVLALTPSADGMSCDVAAVGAIGTATVTMRADADMGQGSVPLVGTVEFTVTAGTATNVNIDIGEASEQE